MRTKILLATLLALAASGPVWSADCARLTKELNRLRLDYKEYAASKDKDKAQVTFNGLVEILDKIIKLKDEMRDARCKVPARK
jgi:hypothetical protein